MPSPVRNYTDVEYGRAGGRSLRLDASIPAGPGPHPFAIIVHGGGWVAGDRRRNVEPLFPTLASADFAWFSISYTLAGDISQFGSAVDDVEQAVRFVLARTSEYGLDPGRMVLMGESAGGQLAAMAALRNPAPHVSAVVAFYTPFDLEHLVGSSPFGGYLARAFPGAGPTGNIGARLRALSPLRHIRPSMPPFLLIHGTDDPVVPFDQSKTMCRAIRDSGGVCDLISVRGGGHGVRWWESAGLTGYKRLMMDWLRKQLRVEHSFQA